MKKFMTMALTGALALSVVLGGCAGGSSEQAAPDDATIEEAEETTDQGGDVVGGWEDSTEATASVTEEQKALFDKAMEGFVGVTYEPIAELATQVVSGTNHAFLCKGTTVTSDPVVGWYVIVVYENLEGEATLSSINELDPAALKVSDEAATDLVGGWQVAEAADVELLPAEAAEAFGKASQSYVGITLRPIATLSAQLVSGTNYLILCEGEPATASPSKGLYVAEVYADLEGGAQMTSVSSLDLVYYVTKAAA